MSLKTRPKTPFVNADRLEDTQLHYRLPLPYLPAYNPFRCTH